MSCGRLEVHAGLAGHTCHAIGQIDLVSDRSKLALLCSSKCPGEIIIKAYDFARIVRASTLAIISGFHSPIEKDCLPILLRGSGAVIIIQGQRLSNVRLPSEWQKAIAAGRLLLLSPFSEKDKRVTRELAVRRNRFVADLSDIVLIPYAHPKSTTESLARELLDEGKRVYTFQSNANAELIAKGAISVTPEFFAKPALNSGITS